MRRALLPLLLVFLMLTTSWAAISSPTTNIEAENTIQLPVDAPLQWSAAEAAKQWTSTTPSSMSKVPLKESSHQVHTVLGSFDPTLDEPPLPPGPFRDHFDVENTRFVIVQLVEHDRTAFEEIVIRLGLVD
ncbi:MAG: hypothetical protein QF885_07500, partial [Candidatus Thalassarchaeaceae archaeon]|nr:hypothetical protein [Candidatus Thalassarchaeaceae archaeon]